MSYEPSFTEETAADEADRRLLAPRACKDCGAVMENGLSDVCAFCWEAEEAGDAAWDDTCARCKGSGTVGLDECYVCDGTGVG